MCEAEGGVRRRIKGDSAGGRALRRGVMQKYCLYPGDKIERRGARKQVHMGEGLRGGAGGSTQ